MDNRQTAETFLFEFCSCMPGDFFNTIDAMQKGLDFILFYLNETDEDVNPGRLAGIMSVSTARVAALMKKLERKGYIKRYPSPEDARRTVVKLTASGTFCVEEKKEHLLGRTEYLVEKVGVEDLEHFIRISKKMMALLEEYESGE